MSIPQQATTQELCDYAVTKLIEQGAPSIRVSIMGSVTCLYRSLIGACALGHLIADEYYDEVLLESSSIDNEDVTQAVVDSIGRELSDEDTSAFQNLQSAHDAAAELSHTKSCRHLPWLTAFNGKLAEVPLSDEVRALVKEAADAEHN